MHTPKIFTTEDVAKLITDCINSIDDDNGIKIHIYPDGTIEEITGLDNWLKENLNIKPVTIKVYNNQPILDIREDGMGLYRDRQPDRGWSPLSWRTNADIKEVEFTKELKVRLLEDLAFTYGVGTHNFNQKLIEFNLSYPL
jgi:hypothetical protein